ncbi:MAG: RNase adapter RapZ [Magnetococcus sp. WYHC-3]
MNPMPGLQQLVLVAGLSGAGKSSVLKFLEDLGFLWVDNPPFDLIGPLAEHHARHTPGTRLAVGLHQRESASDTPEQYIHRLPELRQKCQRLDLVFVEAHPDVLVTRYRETRRRHPLSHAHSVRESILLEGRRLEPLRSKADLVIDTSLLTVPQLKDRLAQIFRDSHNLRLQVILRSFGFKQGLGTDADMVLDARFLPNPHYQPDLRPLTGMDAPVRDYLDRATETQEFFQRIQGLLEYLLPLYEHEKKQYLTVDIGCTGGRHRSVYLVERLASVLGARGVPVLVRHRELERHGDPS